MPLLDTWLRDLPQQFQGRRNIEVLIRAFARQLQELEDVFAALNEKTGLETAAGENLDYVGTIIPLTRKEAGKMAGQTAPESAMPDERYRIYLKYRRMMAANACTYYDIMEAIGLVWGDSPVYYREDPAYPATMLLSTPEIPAGVDISALLHLPVLRPAGVGLKLDILRVTQKREIPVPVFAGAACAGTYIQTSVEVALDGLDG